MGMAVEQFSVQSSLVFTGLSALWLVLIVVGVVLLVSGLLLRNRLKDHSFDKEGETGVGVKSKYTLAIIGIMLIVCGGFAFVTTYGSSSPSVVTVGDGYINVECPDFGYFGANGNKNVTSNEITVAFVGKVGSGDFAVHKQHGLELGDTNIGIFTLGNGATAYIASTNSTNLIIELKNGEYLIVGTSDTQALADSFAQNVHPLTPKQ
jgi:hypothetical protein